MTRPTRSAPLFVPLLACVLVAAALLAVGPAAHAESKHRKIAVGHYVGRELPRHGGDDRNFRVGFRFDVVNGGRSMRNLVVKFHALCGGTWQKVTLPVGSVYLDHHTGEFNAVWHVDVDDDSQDVDWGLRGVLLGNEVQAAYFWWSAGSCSRAVPESAVLWSAKMVSKR